MKIFFTFFLTTFSLFFFSQTKLISYKSHSGNIKNFSADAIDISEGNLGRAPDRIVKTAKLDSVIYVNENESILVTSSTCTTSFLEKSNWKPGREIVRNNKLFSSKNTDSVKKVLKSDYNFQNDIDKVIFVGFKKPTKKELRKLKKETNKVKKSTGQNSENKGESKFYFGLLFVTGLAGVYSWRKNKK